MLSYIEEVSMNTWAQFFGNQLTRPRWFFSAVGILALGYGLLFPRALGSAVNQLLVELWNAAAPLVVPAIQLTLVIIGLLVMFRWARGKGGKK
jgi:hypothetical protein